MGIPRPDPGDLTRTDTAYIRSQIAQLDADAALLRNRSQMTPITRARIDALGHESAALRAELGAETICETVSGPDNNAEQFARAHSLYQKHQAPALNSALSALRDLTSCALPTALERDILQLSSSLNLYNAEISHFSPSQGLTPAILRIFARYG